jgi:hypothetical protein
MYEHEANENRLKFEMISAGKHCNINAWPLEALMCTGRIAERLHATCYYYKSQSLFGPIAAVTGVVFFTLSQNFPETRWCSGKQFCQVTIYCCRLT